MPATTPHHHERGDYGATSQHPDSKRQQQQTDWHRRKRINIKETRNTTDTLPFTANEIETVVKYLDTIKAPGHDRIEVKMIKEAWPEYLRLFNCSLSLGIFPKQYEKSRYGSSSKAVTKILPEVIQANLLSITVKILEIAIAARLTDIANTSERSSKRQYGFRPGRAQTSSAIGTRKLCGRFAVRYIRGVR